MVVAERYSFPYEAQIAKANLESAGIECHIADEHTVNAQWLYSNAIGGVKLMVAEEDLDQARLILSSDFSAALECEEEVNTADECPHCGSTDLIAHTQGKRPAFVVFILLGFPLFFYKHGYKCNQCGEFSQKL